MTSRRDAHLEKVLEAQSELLDLLEGMDYCLDWRPDPSAWSARQVVYHLLDTPPGGIHMVISGILCGEVKEYEIWADRDNVTPERLVYDLGQIREDIDSFFQAMGYALDMATDEDLDGKSALGHMRSRETDEERTVQELLDRVVEGHWRPHLGQIRELRDALGM